MGNSDTIRQGGTVNKGDIVGAWQSVLFISGFLGHCGSSGVDGNFGTLTTQGTQVWQAYAGLGTDGIVGPQTWGNLEARLLLYSGNEYRWYGDNGYVAFWTSGSEWWFWPTLFGSHLTDTNHPGITFQRC